MLNYVQLWLPSWSEVWNTRHRFFLNFIPPFSIFSLAAILVGSRDHIFGRGPSKDHFTKVWLQLAQWFLRRRFLCEFPIGSYVKLSSAVGDHLGRRAESPDTFLEENHPMTISSIFSLVAILVRSRDYRTQFWKRVIQGLFHKTLVAIGPVVSEKIFVWISHRVLC